jgi:arylsulfatase
VDFSQVNDLAAKHPEKLKELQALWQTEAERFNVLPLDDRRYERAADPTRPIAAIARTSYTFYPGTSILHPLAAPQLLGKEHTITANIEVPKEGAEGVLACSGGEFGGWTLFLKDGKFHYVHNYLKLKEDHLASPEVIPAGKHALGIRFTPRETHLMPDYTKGDVAMIVDGRTVGEVKGITVAGQYSTMTGYGLLVGRNTGTPVSHEYKAPSAFTGKLDNVTVELKSNP